MKTYQLIKIALKKTPFLVWFSGSWWKYLIHKANRKGYCSWWYLFWCRAAKHPAGPWYYSSGFEPDYRCKDCGDET